MTFELSIARRLFGHRDEAHRLSRPAVRIAMWGVAVGLAVMILSVCIIIGFKNEIREKVIGFGGHIEIINEQSLYKAEAQPIAFDDHQLQRLTNQFGIAHVQHFCTKTGMIKTNDAFKSILLRGVAEDYDTTFLAAHLKFGRLPHFTASQVTNEIAVSALQASLLGLSVGDKVYTYFFSDQIKARRFLIVGIYETHLREFDNNIVFTDLVTTQHLNSWKDDQYTGVELLINDFDDLEQVTSHVAQIMQHTLDRYGATYTTHNICELYPGIFSWLSLLDTNVYVILILMILLSLFTMSAGLLIIILERTSFIAVMKSMGASNAHVRRIFLFFAAMLVGRGIILGDIFGIGLAVVQQQFRLVHLDPATYYVDSVPIQLSFFPILFLNVATLFITVLVLTLPTFLVSRIQPARVMRFE